MNKDKNLNNTLKKTRKIFLVLFLISMFVFCHRADKPAVTKRDSKKNRIIKSHAYKGDTLQYVKFDFFKEYTIIELLSGNEDYVETFVNVYNKNHLLAHIPFPSGYPNSLGGETKNFAIDSIIPSEYGFKIASSWGGGCCSWNDYFYFYYSPKDDNFYLKSIYIKYFQNYENKWGSKYILLSNPIPIAKLDIKKWYKTPQKFDTLHIHKIDKLYEIPNSLH